MSNEQKTFAPDIYYELSKPFASVNEANAAFLAFQEELYELRKKHRIRNLSFVAEAQMIYENGDIGTPVIVGHFGDDHLQESLLAYAFGRAQAERQERVMSQLEKASTYKVGKKRK